MDFELSEEQQLLLDNVNNFVKKDSPLSRFRGLRSDPLGFSKETWKQMGELGWLGIPFAEADGGLGFSFLESALILERLGTTLVPEPYIPSVLLAGTAIARAGSSDQKAELLGPMLEGERVLALAYAEAQSRHVLHDVETRAEPAAGGYSLSGQKRFVLAGHAADRFVVSARVKGEARAAEGVGLFVVDAKASGVKVTPVQTMDGQRAAMLDLQNVQVGREAVLGDPENGLGVLQEVVDLGAAAACAEGAGVLEAMFEMTKDYLCEREQFGVKIGSFQALQHRCVDMFVELNLAKSTMLLAALRAQAPEPAERTRAISIAKTQLCMSGQLIARQAIQLHGGIGVTDEHDIGLYFKRMNVLNSLFGDEQHHLDRFASLPGFAG